MKHNIAEHDPTIGWRVKCVSRALMVFSALMPWGASADWINLTGAETAPNIAEIYVLDDRVRLVLEVYVGDLDVFADLVPDDWRRMAARGGLDPRSECADSLPNNFSSLPKRVTS